MLLGGIVLCATRLRLDSDILSSLPKGHQEARGFRNLITHFDFFNTAFVLVEGDRSEQVDQTLSVLHTTLKEQSEVFSSVNMGGGSLEELQEFQTWMLDHIALLLPNSQRARLEQKLSPEGMLEHLKHIKERLREPSGIWLKAQFLKDPLGLLAHLDPLLERMKQRAPPMDERGRFSRNNGQERLLILKSKLPAMDSGSALRVNNALRQAAQVARSEGVIIHWGGAYRIVEENAEAVQSSLQRTLWWGGLGLLILFLVILRSPYYILIIFIPSLLACSSAAGWSMLIWPELHVLALAFSGVLIGISTDYSFHACMLIQSKIQDRKAWSPLWAGGLSTALAFGVLWLSEYKCLQQAGVLGCLGIALSLFVTRVGVPQCLAWVSLPPINIQPVLSVARVFAFISSKLGRMVVLGLIICCGGGIFQLRFEGRPEHMDAKSTSSKILEERLSRDWNMDLKPIVLLTQAENREELLQRQEKILDNLQQQDWKGLSFNPWLPSNVAQSERWDWWKMHVTHLAEDQWAAFSQAAMAIGLKPEHCRSAFKNYALEPKVLPSTSSSALLARMEKSFVVDDSGQCWGIVLLNESWDSLKNLRESLPQHSLLLSRSHLAEEMARGIKDEFLKLSLLAGLIILICCLWTFRDINKSLNAIFPVVAGIAVLLGAMGWMGWPADLMTVLMMVMIIGAGVDYGIVLVHEKSHPDPAKSAAMVVVICTSTTVIGLLSMSTAGHPVFRSIGWTGGAGILAVSLLSFIFCHRFKVAK